MAAKTPRILEAPDEINGKYIVPINELTKKIIDTLFLPAYADHRELLSRPLFVVVVFFAVLYSILSLPVIQEIVWVNMCEPSDRLQIIANKDITKAWFESLSFILDLTVAFLIGGSIFGEKLARSFQNSIVQYEKAREALLKNELEELTNDVELTIKESIEKINEIRSEVTFDMLKNLPEIIREIRNIYRCAFSDVPDFYKGYLRFVLYSSFPGGLYGLSAFILFFASFGFKLAAMYLGSMYLVE